MKLPGFIYWFEMKAHYVLKTKKERKGSIKVIPVRIIGVFSELRNQKETGADSRIAIMPFLVSMSCHVTTRLIWVSVSLRGVEKIRPPTLLKYGCNLRNRLAENFQQKNSSDGST